MTRIPPLSALVAFEAAARHLSFTRAAAELNLTQGAVSQRIKMLEDVLGHRVFVREGNTIGITASGQDYLDTVRFALRDLRGATDRVVNRHRGDMLTINCLASFALLVLLPRLNDFRQRHPDIQLRIRTPVPFELAPADDCDVSIQYGLAERWPGMGAINLGEEILFPVCSPKLLDDPGLRAIEELGRHTVIRTSSPLVPEDEWPQWLEQAGVSGLSFAAEINFDYLVPCYLAAVAGLGIAMGRASLVREDIRTGRLVAPFDIRTRSLPSYHLLIGPERASLPKVALFQAWAMTRLQDVGTA